tara:strand:- start:295 stop:420 length:126 start_codon:yes stop_codon:yes gene_type:complete
MSIIENIKDECKKTLTERQKLKESAKQFDKIYKEWTQNKER